VRLGAAGESYVFNHAGQSLDLTDLVVGCGLVSGASVPMITPIKDGMATKIHDATTRLAGCIYYPLSVGGAARLRLIAGELLGWLLKGHPDARGATAVCLPGETQRLGAE